MNKMNKIVDLYFIGYYQYLCKKHSPNYWGIKLDIYGGDAVAGT